MRAKKLKMALHRQKRRCRRLLSGSRSKMSELKRVPKTRHPPSNDSQIVLLQRQRYAWMCVVRDTSCALREGRRDGHDTSRRKGLAVILHVCQKRKRQDMLGEDEDGDDDKTRGTTESITLAPWVASSWAHVRRRWGSCCAPSASPWQRILDHHGRVDNACSSGDWQAVPG